MKFSEENQSGQNLTPVSAAADKRRLSPRISSMLTLIFTLCLFLFSLVAAFATSQNARSKSDATLQQSKSWVQKSFSEPIWSYDESLLADLSRVMISSPEKFVRELTVMDRDGMTIVKESDGSTFEADDIVEKFPILHQGELVGSVELRARPQSTWDFFEGLQMLIWMAAVFLSITLAIVSKAVLERLLSRPLMELIQNMDQVEKANYKINLQQSYSGELSTLAKAFQRAIAGIEQRDRELLRYTQNLEELVENRTIERDKERMNSINSARLASLGEISAGIAHEVNNPLTVIQGTVALIEHDMVKITADAEIRESMSMHLEKISAMVIRITRIIKSLKYLARDGTNDPELEFSVNHMLQEVKTLVTMQMGQRGIEFRSQIPKEQIRLNGQEVQISQVLINLLQNAIDAVAGLPSPTIELSARIENHECVIEVEDSGPGLPADIAEKVFQPFFTTKPVGEGTGLGLSIAHGIVQQHGGELKVASLKLPTVFQIRLPIEANLL